MRSNVELAFEMREVDFTILLCRNVGCLLYGVGFDRNEQQKTYLGGMVSRGRVRVGNF